MLYNIFIDEVLVGLGLSFGELNQWLLDLNKELSKEHSLIFMNDLGYIEKSNLSFEDYIYSVEELNVPLIARFEEGVLEIKEYDF